MMIPMFIMLRQCSSQRYLLLLIQAFQVLVICRGQTTLTTSIPFVDPPKNRAIHDELDQDSSASQRPSDETTTMKGDSHPACRFRAGQ